MDPAAKPCMDEPCRVQMLHQMKKAIDGTGLLLEMIQPEQDIHNKPVTESRKKNAFKTLVATVLSVRSKDETTFKVVENLWKYYNTPADFMNAPIERLEELIRSSGTYHNKAKALKDNSKRWNGKRCDVKLRVVHDPGQAAIDQMERYAEEFKGTGISFNSFREAQIGSKEDRAQVVADHGELYTIYLVEGDWNYDFIQEHVDFPGGRFKDRVDATSMIYSILFKEPGPLNINPHARGSAHG